MATPKKKQADDGRIHVRLGKSLAGCQLVDPSPENPEPIAGDKAVAVHETTFIRMRIAAGELVRVEK